MLDNFYGNEFVVRTLTAMLTRQRIPQTLLFDGTEGVGKATLAHLVERFLASQSGKEAGATG